MRDSAVIFSCDVEKLKSKKTSRINITMSFHFASSFEDEPNTYPLTIAQHTILYLYNNWKSSRDMLAPSSIQIRIKKFFIALINHRSLIYVIIHWSLPVPSPCLFLLFCLPFAAQTFQLQALHEILVGAICCEWGTFHAALKAASFAKFWCSYGDVLRGHNDANGEKRKSFAKATN